MSSYPLQLPYSSSVQCGLQVSLYVIDKYDSSHIKLLIYVLNPKTKAYSKFDIFL